MSSPKYSRLYWRRHDITSFNEPPLSDLEPLEQWLFMRIADLSFARFGIRKDSKIISRLVGLSKRKVDKLLVRIVPLLEEVSPGKFMPIGLHEELLEAIRITELKAAQGKLGGEKRHLNQQRHLTGGADLLEFEQASARLSERASDLQLHIDLPLRGSANSKFEPKFEPTKKDKAFPPAADPPQTTALALVPPKRGRPRKPPHPLHQPAVEAWCVEWEKRHPGDKYVMCPADGAQLARFLKAANPTLEEWKRRLTNAFSDSWFAEHASLRLLCSQWNEHGEVHKGRETKAKPKRPVGMEKSPLTPTEPEVLERLPELAAMPKHLWRIEQYKLFSDTEATIRRERWEASRKAGGNA